MSSSSSSGNHYRSNATSTVSAAASELWSRVQDLKRRIIRRYGNDLLPPSAAAMRESSLAAVGSLNALANKTLSMIRRDDSEEVKQRKIEENNLIRGAREEQSSLHELEQIDELNKIISRVKAARGEYAGYEALYTTGTAAIVVPKLRCDRCGNTNSEYVIVDSLRGDTICNGVDDQGCGNVMVEHAVVHGAERRNFEGDENDRKHFGPAPNKLMPDVVNLQTHINISHAQMNKNNGAFKALKNSERDAERWLEKVGKEDDKHTSMDYKTRQKRKTFALMEEIAENINIHPLVVAKAKEEFAKYRDVKEAVHQYEGVVCACLVISFEELSKSSVLHETRRLAEGAHRHHQPSSSNSSAVSSSSFGSLPARHAVSDDPAVFTIPDLPMRKFRYSDVELWLTAVCGNSAVDYAKQGAMRGEGILSVGGSSSSSSSIADGRQVSTDYAVCVKLILAHLSELMKEGSTVNSSRPGVIGAGRTTTSLSKQLQKDRTSAVFGGVTVSERAMRYKKELLERKAARELRNNNNYQGNNSNNNNYQGNNKSNSGTNNNGNGSLSKSISSSSSSSCVIPDGDTGEVLLTAGQWLARLDLRVPLKSCPGHDEAEQWFRDAIRRRCQYDAFELEQERLQQLQLKRIRLEEGSVHPMIGDTDPGRDDPEGGEASSGDLFEASTVGGAVAEADLDVLLKDLIGGSIKTIIDPVGVSGGQGGGEGMGGTGASDKHKPTTMNGSATIAGAVGDDARKQLSSMNSESSTMNGQVTVLQKKNGEARSIISTGSTMQQPIVPNTTFIHGDETTIQPKVKVEVLKKRKFVIA